MSSHSTLLKLFFIIIKSFTTHTQSLPFLSYSLLYSLQLKTSIETHTNPMDKEQEEMQFLGFFGIYVESYKLIIVSRKIFSKITLSLILPLSFIYLLHMEISTLLFRDIEHTETELGQTKSPTKTRKLNDLISNELAFFWLFKAAYFTLFLIFTLLSTSAVVYTIACIYTARDLTFRKVMAVVPKVWKRLIVTFLCMFVSMFVYNVVSIFIFAVTLVLSLGTDGKIANKVLGILFVLYLVGFIYMTVIWHLANVVSVLEEVYGFKAMMKSKNLLKGKLWIGILIFLKLIIGFVIIQIAFQMLVVHGSRNSAMATRVVVAVVCFLLLSKLILFGLVIQTVIYFVCKSYHHENIDKSALSDHLEVYLGEYVPLKAKDVQLEQYQV